MVEKGHILVADDDPAVREIVTEALERDGFRVTAVETLEAMMSLVGAKQGHVLISDVMMPDGDGIAMLSRIKGLRPHLPVIIMSAKNTLSTAVSASKEGAFEYLPKPFDINELLSTVNNAINLSKGEARALRTPEFDTETPLVGRSSVMQKVYRSMARVIPTDLTVLIEGASGTGKELVARAIHDLGTRAGGPFVAVNMAAIPKDLIESELFGHEKGAFTGAEKRYQGRFEEARGGTLFLDEIGDMPMEAQTRLLRVLQQGEFRPVGGSSLRRVNARIISATHRSLKSLVREGSFREDLFYRLNVVPIVLPKLAKRSEDIPELIAKFMDDNVKAGLPHKRFSKGAIDLLKEYSWPGNVRELQNLVRRFSALYSEELISKNIVKRELKSSAVKKALTRPKHVGENLAQAVDHHLARYFEAHLGSLPPAGLYDRILREVERPLIVQSLQATGGNQLKAAELLGLNRNTLRKKITDLKIDPRRL